ncbi:hypothetical protein MMC10_006829 [Thelotrema lepadinum]|nr:hypothetical protein [Thelotrema lepadinum]
MIRTFTLHIEPVPSEREEKKYDVLLNGNAGCLDLQHGLDELARRLISMNRLTSLSITRTFDFEVAGFWINRENIIKIVDNLPKTCVSLEIDTRDNEDNRNFTHPHLCPSIRRILPRLQYLRLRLNNFCPDLCGLGYNPASPTIVTEAFRPVEAPHLKQCIINISRKEIRFGMSSSSICGDFYSRHYGPCEALAMHLRAMVRSGNATKLERLWILDFLPKEESEGAISYQAYVRRDICAERSLAFPIRNINRYRKDSWLIRVPVAADIEDAEYVEDLLSPSWALQDLAEGESWQENLTGVRLPAPVMGRTGLSSILPVLTREQFGTETNLSCRLWDNENIVGTRLLDVRNGDLMERTGIVESTPNGWIRLKRSLIREDNVTS